MDVPHGKKNHESTRRLVLAALFTAIIVLLGATNLGILMITPAGISIVHIPVIAGAILLGPGYGAYFGFLFGSVSFCIATFTQPLSGFAFSPFSAGGPAELLGNPLSLVVCFVPRILIGVLSPLVFRAMRRLTGNSPLSSGVAAAAGSLTNTLLVLGFIYLFFTRGSGEALQIFGGSLLTLAGAQGVPEAIAAAGVLAALGAVPVFKKSAAAGAADLEMRQAENRFTR